MAIEAERAIRAFLERFKYTDDSGKRANSNFFTRLFQNKALTTQLETIANALRQDLEKILADTKLSPGEKFNAFRDKIDDAWNKIKHKRDILASTNTHTITRPINPTSPFDVYGPVGPHEVTYYETHKPYGIGKLEENLIAGLNAAAKELIGDTQQYCQLKAHEIAEFKPQETKSEERTFRSSTS